MGDHPSGSTDSIPILLECIPGTSLRKISEHVPDTPIFDRVLIPLFSFLYTTSREGNLIYESIAQLLYFFTRT